MEFKVKCVEVPRNVTGFTVGKVYTVKDGGITDNNGFTFSCWSDGKEGTIKDLNWWFAPKFKFELVEGEKKTTEPKFKVGDIVVGKSDVYAITGKGWEGVVSGVVDESMMYVQSKYDTVQFPVLSKYFDLLNRPTPKKIAPEKIVITHDGKTTTATLYMEDGTKRSATAACHPEDNFNFAVGARLATDRLFGTRLDTDLPCDIEEKKEPVVVGGFKVGDRVHWVNRNGTVIAISHNGTIGVEFDKKEVGFHNCKYIPLPDGKPGTGDKSYWVSHDELEHGEYVEPKGWSGKAVYVDNFYAKTDGFCVGKVYTFTDGKTIDDDGDERPFVDKIRDVEDLRKYDFVPFVE